MRRPQPRRAALGRGAGAGADHTEHIGKLNQRRFQVGRRLRQAMVGDNDDPVGLYLGTTSGEVWASADEGASFTCIARHLPEIYALTVSSCA